MYESEKVKVLVAQSCLILCDPMDCSVPGSSVHGMLQVRILEWVAIPFSRGSSQLGIEPGSPTLQADSLPSKPPGKPPQNTEHLTNLHVILDQCKKKIIYHISLALNVDHREGRGIWFCDMSTKSGWGIINLEFRVQMPGFKFQLYIYWL